MRKKRNISLFFLTLIFSFCFFSHNLEAVDICSPYSIGGQDAANKYCPTACGFKENWNGNWLMDSPSLTCGEDNQKNSVCGCIVDPVCHCENGNQIQCLMPSSCPGGFWSCDCPKGTSCDDFRCQVDNGDSCAACYSTCMTLCNNVPREIRGDCWSQCGADRNDCESGSGPCAKKIEEKKKAKKKNKIDQEKSPKKKEKPSSPPSTFSEEKDDQDSSK